MWLRKKLNFLQILLFAPCSLLFSQEISTEPDETTNEKLELANTVSMFNMFREPSYIIFGSGLGNLAPLVFEADIIPYFMISLSPNSQWGIEISPRIILRMFNKESYPVQTPSYMPRATVFYQFKNGCHGGRGFFTYLSWMHHSNGQDGGFYDSDKTTINVLTGNFTTYWLEGGLFLSRPSKIVKFNTNFVKLHAAYNYKPQKELYGIYGDIRFFLNFSNTVKLPNGFRSVLASKKKTKEFIFDQSIKIGWIADKLIDTKIIDKHRLIFNYTLSFKPYFFKDVNFFVHYYYGQDYYNINFNRQINVIRFGIASKSNVLN